jgi:hypothetical protein
MPDVADVAEVADVMRCGTHLPRREPRRPLRVDPSPPPTDTPAFALAVRLAAAVLRADTRVVSLRLTSVKLVDGVMLPKAFWAGSVGHEDEPLRDL